MKPHTPAEPSIKPEQHDELRRLYDSHLTYAAIAEHFGTSITSVRRALDRINIRTTNRYRGQRERIDHPDDSRAIRITDYPTTITAHLMGDPTPARLAMIHGGRG